MQPIDIDMMRRYDVRAPRYTSYPTALHFTDDIDAAAARADLESVAGTARPVSLYAHIPYCNSLCWYCACSRVITRDNSKGDRYLDRLFREFDTTADALRGRPVVQLHLGGGTPTFLTPDQLVRLAEGVRERFTVDESGEWSIEVDPRAVTDAHLDALVEAGFGRASLGVQDNDPDVQKAIHRIQPWDTTRQLVADLRARGFGSTNFDLIYGLPRQTRETFSQTIDDVLEVMPERLAVYSYAHIPWAQPQQKLLERHPRPGSDEKLGLLKMTIERLTDAGYVYIGMDHFALPDDPLAVAFREGSLRRNFQGYSTLDGVDIHAFGVTAISQTEQLYVQNEKDLGTWEARVDAGERPVLRGVRLSDEDQIRRAMIMEIMCRSRVDYDAFASRWGERPTDYFGDAIDRLTPLEDDGLLVRSDDALDITDLGRLFLRNIALEFDGRIAAEANRYSRAI
jgi:oxygen-independent coproporphyrinogen-3 oxidase